MTTVNGGSLQAAIDAAPVGDTLDLKPGTYGSAKINKQLTLRSDGGAQISGAGVGAYGAAILITADGVVLDGLTVTDSDCYGVRLYQHNGLQASNLDIGNVAAGVEVHRNGANCVFTNVNIHDVSKMVTDVDGGANGGDAYQIVNTTGPISIKGGTLERLRAKSVYAAAHWNTPVDGGGYNIFGGSSDVTIEDQVIRDAVNLTETGKNPTDGDSYRVTFRNVKYYGNNSPDPYWISAGAFVRSGIDYIFDSCEFHQADQFALLLTGGGNFGGTLSGLTFTNNKVWLGTSQAYALTVANSAIGLLDGNQVYIPAGYKGPVATVRGVQTTDIEQFRSLIGQKAPNERWGAEVIVPPPDPCADVKAQLATMTAQLAVTTTQRDALRDIDQRALAVLNDKKQTQTHRIQGAKAILMEEGAV